MPFLVVSDLHLSPASTETSAALSALVRAHAGVEIVLSGDSFGLSSDPPARDPRESVASVLSAQPELAAALRAHLAQGGKLSFLAGNHDEALTNPDMPAALSALLELSSGAALSVSPWFIRRGDVHIEHGHLWDPDNAPAHPLASWSVNSEPLGIALTRRFIAKRGVYEFAHAHETTLLRGLTRAFRLFGARAPLLVGQYFAASACICFETLFDRGLAEQRASGARALPALSQESGVSRASLEALLHAAPAPTHAAFRSTFFRLYYDRVLASALVSAGLSTALIAPPLGALATLAGSAYLYTNVKQSGARYRDRPQRLLRHGADEVRRLTDAKLVVFGHTHVPVIEPGYANAGSFGYPGPGGRPYLWVNEAGEATVRRWGA